MLLKNDDEYLFSLIELTFTVYSTATSNSELPAAFLRIKSIVAVWHEKSHKCECTSWFGFGGSGIHRVLVIVEVAATTNKGTTAHVEGGTRTVRGVDAVIAVGGPAVVVVGIACFGSSV